MIQDFTFFANITASYVNRKRQKKMNQSKTKPNQRSEWRTRSFYIVFHPLGVNIILMQTSKLWIQNRNTQTGVMPIRRERGWEPIKMAGGDVSSMDFDSSFTLKLRTSRSGGLLSCRCTGVGRCSAQCGWRGGKVGENGQFSSLSAETEVRFW